MREYFRNARVIYKEARRALDWNERNESSLLTQFRDWRSRLSNSEFTVSNERIYLRSPAQLTADPAIILRLLEFVARHGIPLAAETERRAEQAGEIFAAYCERAQPLWPAAPRHPLASLRRRGAPHDARYRAPAGHVPRVAEHFLPGCSGLLPSLHRGRAHSRGHRKARRTGREQRSRPAPSGRNSLGSRRPGAAPLRAAFS